MIKNLDCSEELYFGVCSQRYKDVDLEYKRRAVEFWNNNGKRRKLGNVQHNFKLVSSERQLRKWANQLEVRGTKKEKLLKISEYVIQKLRNATEAGYILHDRDLRQPALKAYKELGDSSMVFKASRKWIHNFKIAHRIDSRKVTKFITPKSIEDDEVLNTKATEFVNEITFGWKVWTRKSV